MTTAGRFTAASARGLRSIRSSHGRQVPCSHDSRQRWWTGFRTAGSLMTTGRVQPRLHLVQNGRTAGCGVASWGRPGARPRTHCGQTRDAQIPVFRPRFQGHTSCGCGGVYVCMYVMYSCKPYTSLHRTGHTTEAARILSDTVHTWPRYSSKFGDNPGDIVLQIRGSPATAADFGPGFRYTSVTTRNTVINCASVQVACLKVCMYEGTYIHTRSQDRCILGLAHRRGKQPGIRSTVAP
ncbi:hypothetical protein VTG60DRAFT_3902 [Thermothelomyces hinnuleus]